MTLYEKIKAIYPSLTIADFDPMNGTINLICEDGVESIRKWEHPTLERPTDEELHG